MNASLSLLIGVEGVQSPMAIEYVTEKLESIPEPAIGMLTTEAITNAIFLD